MKSDRKKKLKGEGNPDFLDEHPEVGDALALGNGEGKSFDDEEWDDDEEDEEWDDKGVIKPGSRTLDVTEIDIEEMFLEDGFIELQDASDSSKSNKKVVLSVVGRDGQALEYASDDLKADEEIVIQAVKTEPSAIKHASKKLLEDESFIIKVIQENASVFKYVPEMHRCSRHVAVAAVGKRGCFLELLSEQLKEDKEIVMKAVYQDGLSIKHAAKELQEDKSVVIAALEQIHNDVLSYTEIGFSSEDFSNLMTIGEIWEEVFGVDRWAEKKFVEIVLKLDAEYFPKMSLNLKIDSSFVKSVIRNNIKCFRYADWVIRNDKEFILSLIEWSDIHNLNEDILSDERLGETLWNDKEIIKLLLPNAYNAQYWFPGDGYNGSLLAFFFGDQEVPKKVLAQPQINSDSELMQMIVVEELARSSEVSIRWLPDRGPRTYEAQSKASLRLDSLRFLPTELSQDIAFISSLPQLAVLLKHERGEIREYESWDSYKNPSIETLLFNVAPELLDNPEFLLRFKGEYPILRFASDRLRNDIDFLVAYNSEIRTTWIDDWDSWCDSLLDQTLNGNSDCNEYDEQEARVDRVIYDTLNYSTGEFFTDRRKAFYYLMRYRKHAPRFAPSLVFSHETIAQLESKIVKCNNEKLKRLYHHWSTTNYPEDRRYGLKDIGFHPIVNLPNELKQDSEFIRSVLKCCNLSVVVDIMYAITNEVIIDKDLAMDVVSRVGESIFFVGDLMFDEDVLKNCTDFIEPYCRYKEVEIDSGEIIDAADVI